VGRDIKNSPITIGIPAEKLPAIIEAATKDWRALTDQQKQTIDALQNNLGVNENALKAFFATLGENEVSTDRLSEKLLEIAGHYKKALVQSAPGPNDGPEFSKVKSAANHALEAGQLERADELLEELERLQDAAIASEQLERASTSAERGQLAMSRLRYQEAAQRFADAAKHVPEERSDIRLGYLDQEADALYRQGNERGENTALIAAIERYRILLTLRPRDRVPLDWAMTQNNLGNALATLGQRENDMTRLEGAVAAYHAALEEWTRDRVPLDWAMTQNNLGNALRALGERESGMARLEGAVAAYRAALQECPRDRVPLDWATTQMNLGNALEALGEREAGTVRLEEAVAAYHAALEERTRERVPLDWAMTQMNLGLALKRLGERQSGPARLGALEAAVAAWEACLKITASSWPPEWVQFVKTRRDETLAGISRGH
jgi:tetratricopeptide (TPR) repeat protein